MITDVSNRGFSVLNSDGPVSFVFRMLVISKLTAQWECSGYFFPVTFCWLLLLLLCRLLCSCAGSCSCCWAHMVVVVYCCWAHVVLMWCCPGHVVVVAWWLRFSKMKKLEEKYLHYEVFSCPDYPLCCVALCGGFTACHVG